MSFWQWSRGWRCSITAQRVKYSSGEGYQTAHRCSISRQLSFLDNYLFEQYHFTSQSIIYIPTLIHPYICNITNRSHALTSQQILCVALRFFANGSFLYNVGDAEHLSKATVCRAVRKVCLAMARLLPMFVVFPGHKPTTRFTGICLLSVGWVEVCVMVRSICPPDLICESDFRVTNRKLQIERPRGRIYDSSTRLNSEDPEFSNKDGYSELARDAPCCYDNTADSWAESRAVA